MRCPTCAERVRLVRLFGRRECPHCGTELRFTPEGDVVTLARERAEFDLDRPAAGSDRLLLVIGVVVTGALSAIPTAGILTGLVLPVLQVYCIERATRRHRQHFGFLHGLSYDLFSGLLFLALVVAEGAAGAFFGPLAAALNVPIFLVTWFAARAYARSHLRRVAAGLPPHPIERGILAATGLVLLAPPIALAIVLLIGAVQGAGSEGPSSVSPTAFLETLSTSTVLALDLFLLPLWACAGVLVLGLAAAPVSAGWVGSWWVFGLVTVALTAEVVLDNALDRRRRFSRSTWPRLQFVLTPFTLLAIILVLGHGLSWWGKAVAFGGALSLAGIIKFGTTEPVKNAVGLLPGALAQRKAMLYTAPVRIAIALGLAYLAFKLPLLATVALGVVALIALLVLLIQQLVRLRARRAKRIACRGCGFKALEIARLCPRCHAPVMTSRILKHPPEVRRTMLEVAAAFAWADGSIDPEEGRMLEAVVNAAELPAETAAQLTAKVGQGTTLDEVDLAGLSQRQRDDVLEFASVIALADGTVRPEERALWRALVAQQPAHGSTSMRMWFSPRRWTRE